MFNYTRIEYLVSRIGKLINQLTDLIISLHLSRDLYKSTIFLQNKAKLQNDDMNATTYITKVYDNLLNFCRRKNKAKQSQNKANLQNAKKNVSPFMTTYYENLRTFCRPKNEPKRTQNKPNFGPKLALFFTKNCRKMADNIMKKSLLRIKEKGL